MEKLDRTLWKEKLDVYSEALWDFHMQQREDRSNLPRGAQEKFRQVYGILEDKRKILLPQRFSLSKVRSEKSS